MNIQAVIFDWAGTTVDFGCKAPVKAFMRVFEENQVFVTERQAREPMGLSKRDHIIAMTENPKIMEIWIKKHGLPPNESDIDRMYTSYTAYVLKEIKKHSQLIKGMDKTIEFLREHDIKIGSTTGYTKQMHQVIADELGNQYKPDCVITSDMVKHGRPSPEMIHLNLKNLNVTPARTVIVDDSIPGLIAGRAAGCIVVYVAASGNALGLSEDEFYNLEPNKKNELLKKSRAEGSVVADYVIDTVAELPSLISKL